jgi:Predicted phosphatases
MLKARYALGCEKEFDERSIKYAFHDIDGTHSLIRNWPPVMSAVLNDVIERGLAPDFDSEDNTRRLIGQCGTRPLEETDRFCVESAGMSALTQMEWAIRRAVEEGKVDVTCDRKDNSLIIRRIWQGEERFDDIPETPEMLDMLSVYTPRLFKLYERVLNGFCRDRNLAVAKQAPERFRVKGSMEFITALYRAGVKNYFVTGAVVQKGMGMFEEVECLGYPIGKGQLIEDIIGSTWDKKLPKDEIMLELAGTLGARGEEILVTGDGRSEISAGVSMGALTLSRLNSDAVRQRQLHRQLGTHMIVTDFFDPLIGKVFG